jgi:putative ubiquitin-RnfH superfamily antitoxin RatB of RatAB toxin-antitoxin module
MLLTREVGTVGKMRKVRDLQGIHIHYIFKVKYKTTVNADDCINDVVLEGNSQGFDMEESVLGIFHRGYTNRNGDTVERVQSLNLVTIKS